MAKALVVITGASRGIGRAVATKFAAEGHPLLLVARHPEPLGGVPTDQIRQAAVDVADYAALEDAIRQAEAVFGPTECLVNNAGFLRIASFEDRPIADISYEVDVLLKGVLNGIRAVQSASVWHDYQSQFDRRPRRRTGRRSLPRLQSGHAFTQCEPAKGRGGKQHPGDQHRSGVCAN